jgi:uncharacterized protein YndB with AHSA1/START domain
MRAIKIFVILSGGLIVFGLLALFIMGRRPEAGRITGIVEVDAPPASVLAWLTEPAKLKQWVGWLANVQGDTTAAAVGRRQVWVMDDHQSGAISMSTELTMFQPPDSMRVHLEVPGMVEGDNLYTLTDLAGRTRLVVEGRYRHPNPIVALLEPLATPEAAAKLKADMARLRTMIELATAEGPGAAAAPDSPGLKR